MMTWEEEEEEEEEEDEATRGVMKSNTMMGK